MKKFLQTGDNSKDGKLFNFRPVLFAAVFLGLGIAFAYARIFKGASFLWLLFGIPLLGMPFLFLRGAVKAFLTAGIFALCFSLGALSFSLEWNSYRTCGGYAGECTVTGTVVEKKVYENFSMIVLSGITIDGNEEKGKLVAYLGVASANEIELSDEVLMLGKVETEISLFDEYGFQAEEIVESIKFRAAADSIQTTGRGFRPFLAARSRLKQVLYTGMDQDSASVAYALFTGDTSGIENGLLENVRRGGIAHIFAVSGLHVGALYAFCLLLTEKTRLQRLSKPARFFLVSAVLLFYGGVANFSPSVLRATVMCLVFYASKLIGNKPDLLESAGVAAFLVLLFRPALLFEVGFRLSFAACFSIGILSRRLLDGFDLCLFVDRRALAAAGKPPSLFSRFRCSVSSFLAASFAAQIGTAPLLLSAFGYLSVWSLFLNCLFVPLIGGVFAGLLALTFVACLLPIAAAPVLLYVPSVLWAAALLIFYAADFSFVLAGIRLGAATAAYYALFVVCSDKLQMTKRVRILFVLSLIFAFAAGMAWTNAPQSAFLVPAFPCVFAGSML